MSWRKKNDSFGKIKEVTELQSLPGFEGQVRNHIRQKITPHVDRIGNRWARWNFWYQGYGC